MITFEDKDTVIESIDAMFKYFFKCSFFDLELLEDGLYYKYDTSIHGSPYYQYKLITKDKNLIEIYDHLIKLRDLAFKSDK